MTRSPKQYTERGLSLLKFYERLSIILHQAIPMALNDLDHTRFCDYVADLESDGFTHACGTYRCVGGWAHLCAYGEDYEGWPGGHEGFWVTIGDDLRPQDYVLFKDKLGELFDSSDDADESNEETRKELLRRQDLTKQLMDFVANELESETIHQEPK